MISPNPVFALVIPFVFAFLSVFIKKTSKAFLIAGSLINLAVIILMQHGEYVIGGYRPPYGIALYVDNYAYFSAVVINILFTLLIILAAPKAQKVAPFLLITLASLNALILTGDLFNLFVSLEITSIAAIIIASARKKLVSAFNYLVTATIGGAFYLLGLALLYSQYGTLNMAKMHDMMLASPPSSYIPVILIFVGLAVETKLLPFNGWVKGILNDADELLGPLIGSVYTGVMLIVFGRLFADVFVLSDQVVWMMSVMAVVTMIAGEASAFSSGKIREVLLYSSVAQSGLAVVLMLNGFTSVAILVIFSNIAAKFVLFLLAGVISSETGTDDIGELSGIFSKKPLSGLAFTVAGISLVGLPLFFGFFVKINTLYNLFLSGAYLLPGVILLAALLEGVYMIRMLVRLWNPGNEGEASGKETATKLNYSVKPAVCATVLVISMGLVVLGILPDRAIAMAKASAGDLAGNKPFYAFTLKGGEKQ